MVIQHITIDGKTVSFIDACEGLRSAKCQPRDIKVVAGPKSKDVIEEIVADTRRGQGFSDVGLLRDMKWEG